MVKAAYTTKLSRTAMSPLSEIGQEMHKKAECFVCVLMGCETKKADWAKGTIKMCIQKRISRSVHTVVKTLSSVIVYKAFLKLICITYRRQHRYLYYTLNT